jgi:hypothetical protein
MLYPPLHHSHFQSVDEGEDSLFDPLRQLNVVFEP